VEVGLLWLKIYQGRATYAGLGPRCETYDFTRNFEDVTLSDTAGWSIEVLGWQGTGFKHYRYAGCRMWGGISFNETKLARYDSHTRVKTLHGHRRAFTHLFADEALQESLIGTYIMCAYLSA